VAKRWAREEVSIHLRKSLRRERKMKKLRTNNSLTPFTPALTIDARLRRLLDCPDWKSVRRWTSNRGIALSALLQTGHCAILPRGIRDAVMRMWHRVPATAAPAAGAFMRSPQPN